MYWMGMCNCYMELEVFLIMWSYWQWIGWFIKVQRWLQSCTDSSVLLICGDKTAGARSWPLTSNSHRGSDCVPKVFVACSQIKHMDRSPFVSPNRISITWKGVGCVLNSYSDLRAQFWILCKSFKECHPSSRAVKEFHSDDRYLLEMDAINLLKPQWLPCIPSD